MSVFLVAGSEEIGRMIASSVDDDYHELFRQKKVVQLVLGPYLI